MDYMVGEEGLEPSLPCENQILSLARLPIPPLARIVIPTRGASTIVTYSATRSYN